MTKGKLYDDMKHRVFTDKTIRDILDEAKKEFPMGLEEEGIAGLANLCGARADWFKKWFGENQ